jgi:two-component system, LytTR family, response regulator
MPDLSPYKCLIVDDEPPAREIMKTYIVDTPLLQLVGECENAVQALSYLQQNNIDLLFLDINMPQLSGMELLKILKHPPKVIFTTAHPEYALQGYELDVVDYLLKPIQFDRFLKAVHKAIQYPVYGTETVAPPLERQEPFVYFRADRKMVKVMLKEIQFIEGMKDYIKIVTETSTIITKQSMTSVEAMLPEGLFVRVHRSFIVSVQKIRSYTTEMIEMEGTEIPIGKLFRNSVMKLLS